MDSERTPAPFITFYSFKGGVGRSMALINAAGILAGQRGFRVLVIDMDLEAPGLSYLDPEMPDQPADAPPHPSPQVPGFIDLIADALEGGQEADLFALSPKEFQARYTRPVKLPPDLRKFPDGSLHLMAAGALDEDYSLRLNAIDFRSLYAEGIGEPLIRAFKKTIAESGIYDYVLIDSRTGFSDEGGICTRDLADQLMVLSGLNRQNIEGTSNFLRALRTTVGEGKKIQIILSPVPNGEDALLDQREEAARKAFREAWGSDLNLSLQIPYHPQLALTEEPHIFRRRKGHLFHAYREIERRMLEMLGHDGYSFLGHVMVGINSRDYSAAIKNAKHMIRLDEGDFALARLVDYMIRDFRTTNLNDGALIMRHFRIDEALEDNQGRIFMEFLVESVPVSKHGSNIAFELSGSLESRSPLLADRLFRRMIEATPDDSNLLCTYATFLWREDKEIDRAEAYFRKALETNSKDQVLLGTYASFLWNQRRDFRQAESYFVQALAVFPNDRVLLNNCATLLWQPTWSDNLNSSSRRASSDRTGLLT